jgi:hypothetical protein
MPDDPTGDCREHARAQFGWIDPTGAAFDRRRGMLKPDRSCATCGAWTADPLSTRVYCAVIRCETHALAVCDHHWSC